MKSLSTHELKDLMGRVMGRVLNLFEQQELAGQIISRKQC